MGEIILNGEKYIGNDISGKADKVRSATNGNLAGLDANGDLTDSGIAAGNTSISSIGDGTLTGAVSAENGAINAIVNVYGSKNLFVVNAINDGGLTVIKNSDGSISISAGTTSSELLIPSGSLVAQKELAKQLLPNTKYIFSIGTSSPSVYLQAFYLIEGGTYETLVTMNNVDQIEFTTPSTFDAIWVRISVANGDTLSPITFYPMLRDARISDSTYVPYAMTNRELTEKCTPIDSVTDGNVHPATSNAVYDANKLKVSAVTYAYTEDTYYTTRNYEKGDYIYVKNHDTLCQAVTNISSGQLLIDPTNIRPVIMGEQITQIESDINNLSARLNIKKKTVPLSSSTIPTLSPTATSLGYLTTFFDIFGLTQEKIIGITCYNIALDPSAIAIFGVYNNVLYIAATQNCIASGTGYVTVAYID